MGCVEIFITLVVWSLVLCQYGLEGGRTLSHEEDMELERQLTVLNKKPIKTFQTSGGIYDCIDIYKQPAFDHPLLRNHKIQMRPAYQPKPATNKTWLVEKGTRATLEGVTCPQGTVPIRRTQKEDLLRAKNFTESHSTNIHPSSTDHPGKHTAVLSPSDRRIIYHGVKGSVNIYGLEVKDDQSSTGQVWIEHGQLQQYTSLQAGWMVSPSIGGDTNTQLFVYWTPDNSKTGCYNLLCPGFVQVDKNYGPTSQVYPVSVYGGPQYGFEVAIFQDVLTGNWWVSIKGINVGYWPKSIVPQLDKGASFVAWGGLVLGTPFGDSAPMGNGHFPTGDWSKACFFKELQTLDASNQYVMPNEKGMLTDVDNHKCYDLIYMGYYKRGGLAFMFGGPGGKCGE